MGAVDVVLDERVTREVRAAAEAYCAALHACDAAALARIFAPAAHLYAAEAGEVVDLPRDAWLERVAGRVPPDAAPEFAVEMVDASGPETAIARVSVRVGERLFRDHLSFLKTGGSWRVIAKVYRRVDGPAA